MKAAKDGAIRRKRNGIVIIDPKKAVGQKQIVEACPYGVIFWNEEKNLPQKCTLCAHRIDEGKIPRCVQICPSGCLTFGDFDDPDSEVSKLLADRESRGISSGMEDQAQYLLCQSGESHHATLLRGAIAYKDVNECAEGALVVLKGPKGRTLKTKANAFGNFEFDGLLPGEYSVRIEAPVISPRF